MTVSGGRPFYTEWAPRYLPWASMPAIPVEAAGRKCIFCDALIVGVDTGWGANWLPVGVAGPVNGLCEKAPRSCGVHKPRP